jgi:hypothetical protein
MIDESPFWVVWNPEHPATPTVRYPTRGAATRAAKNMAEKHAHEGATFYVLKAQSYHQQQIVMQTWTMSEWGIGAPCPYHHAQR